MLTACMAFYSPSGYRLPQEYLASTLAWLTAARVPVVLAQVVKPGGEPQPVPPGVRTLVYESSDAIFFKENLWNLAAAATDADKLLFLDADVRFSRDDVAVLTDDELDRCDVMQPYETALWFDRHGDLSLARRSAAYALRRGIEPASGLYHPGFAWGMTRAAFNRVGGFYELHPFGGGDVAWTHSLDATLLDSARLAWTPDMRVLTRSRSFLNYQRNATAAGLKVGYLPGVEVYHRWHGDVDRRQYQTRYTLLPIPDGEEYPLRRRPDGLVEWTSAPAASVMQRYFDSRMEDG
jgi:hypothetical protein